MNHRLCAPWIALATFGVACTPESGLPACKTDLTPELATTGAPGISAAVVMDGAVVCTAVAGMADTTTGRRVTPDTAFTWASVSKTITATVLMQLVERGELQLDDDVATLLGFEPAPARCAGQPVTYRHLLTHTSGIIDNDDLMPYVDGDSTVSLAQFVPGYLTPGGAFYDDADFVGCAGTRYEYSSSGVATLAYVAEKITGTPFDEYTREHVLAPLAMDNSSFRYREIDASTYAKPNGKDQVQGFYDYPAGTFTSSPTNLAKFLAAYTNGGTYDGVQILKPETVAEMTTPQTTFDATQGLIWYSSTEFDTATTWGHDGDDPGINTEMQYNPTTKTGVLVATNGDENDADLDDAVTALFAEAASR